MKKIISIILALSACVVFTACKNTSNTNSFAGLKLVRAEVDRITYDSLESIENASELVVVGKFIDDTVQRVEYKSISEFDSEVVDNVISTNTLKISRVLKGNKNSGDEIKVSVRYGVVDGNLLTFSSLTPMQKGDEWVFFLKKQSDADIYWHRGDADGRYPTKNTSGNGIMPLAESPELDVYDKADFNEKIYNEIVEKYGI